MKWFLAKYIFQIVTGEDNYNAQFDEQLRLLKALSSNEAFEKAVARANDFHPPFENCKGEIVTWKFICVAELHEIQAPADGAEIASILHEPNDVPFFLDHVHKRKEYLQQQIGVQDLVETREL